MKERNYGIDLLRLVLMYMVCILHVLGQGGILHASAEGTAAYYTFWFLEILAYGAVDAFALITGYTAVDRPIKYEKLIRMWFQAFFYSFIFSFILTFCGVRVELTAGDWISFLMPVTFNVFWYFTGYTVLFFAIPVLNRFLFSVENRTAKKALALIFLLFSCQGVLTDPYQTQAGYSALWLIVLYCFGVLAKRVRFLENVRSIRLLFLWLICIDLTWCEKTVLRIGLLTEYISPTILFSSLLMVELFSRLRLTGKHISKLSPMAFGIYLFQCNGVVWENLSNAFAYIASISIIEGVVRVLLLAAMLFAAGLMVEFIRTKLEQLLKIQSMSSKLACSAERTLEKFCQ